MGPAWPENSNLFPASAVHSLFLSPISNGNYIVPHNI
jgi:hypothetical protein